MQDVKRENIYDLIVNNPEVGEAMRRIAQTSFMAGWMMARSKPPEDLQEQAIAEKMWLFFESVIADEWHKHGEG